RGWFSSIVDIVVATVYVALVDNQLQIEHHIGICLSQRNANPRQAFSKRQAIDFEFLTLPAPVDTGLVRGHVGLGYLKLRGSKFTNPSPQQIDLDQVDLCSG